jgi:hypothetical protein
MVRKLSLVLLPLAAALLGGPAGTPRSGDGRDPATRHAGRPAEDPSGRPTKQGGLARATVEAKAPIKRHGGPTGYGLPAARLPGAPGIRVVRAAPGRTFPPAPSRAVVRSYFPTGPPERA